MRIVIAGAGEVGLHLSKLLSSESHDITLIDNNQINLKDGENYLDIKVINGDSSSPKTLKKSGVSSADLVIGVTASESVNLLTCFLSKNLGAKRKDIVCVIGPTIHKESYEIKKDVAHLVKETEFYKQNHSMLFEISENKYLFDLPLIIKESLKFSKIKNFGDIYMNTYEKSNLFFSHRKSSHKNFPNQGKTGRHISVIGLIG